MTLALVEKAIAFVGAVLVAVTAIIQLRGDWGARGLDASITKLLLGLMAIGCVLALLAAINILGARA